MVAQSSQGFTDSTTTSQAALPGDFSHSAKDPAARVLVVDDEPLVRWSVRETLAAQGYEVVEAGDGRSAMAALALQPGRIDAVLLDVRMPDCDDLHVLAAMRERAPTLPIALMTAYGTPELSQAAKRLGATAMLDKPFDMSEVSTLVQRMLASRPN